MFVSQINLANAQRVTQQKQRGLGTTIPTLARTNASMPLAFGKGVTLEPSNVKIANLFKSIKHNFDNLSNNAIGQPVNAQLEEDAESIYEILLKRKTESAKFNIPKEALSVEMFATPKTKAVTFHPTNKPHSYALLFEDGKLSSISHRFGFDSLMLKSVGFSKAEGRTIVGYINTLARGLIKA